MQMPAAQLPKQQKLHQQPESNTWWESSQSYIALAAPEHNDWHMRDCKSDAHASIGAYNLI
jgi:hypothetical protein